VIPASFACQRHPAETKPVSCTRCGDFVCAACRAEAGGTCLACRDRPEPVPPRRTFALWAAAALSALSGLFFLGLAGLAMLVNGGSPELALTGIVGVVYLAIAVGLVRLSPRAYSWAIGTNGMNAVLAGLAFAQGAAGIAKFLLAFRLVLHVLSLLFTRLAKPALTEPSLLARRRLAQTRTRSRPTDAIVGAPESASATSSSEASRESTRDTPPSPPAASP
jgi:hypothetical protein